MTIPKKKKIRISKRKKVVLGKINKMEKLMTSNKIKAPSGRR
tara:strand:- start:7156 stop:7281 length:126 start_codon:yes stop_codon:yes gene_type:complete